MFKRLFLGSLVFGMAAMGPPAHAQTSCAPRESIIERLEASFGEALTGGGLQSASQILELWTAPETGTWTALVTNANGISCIVASGTNFHIEEPNLPVAGVPS